MYLSINTSTFSSSPQTEAFKGTALVSTYNTLDMSQYGGSISRDYAKERNLSGHTYLLIFIFVYH